MPSYYYMDFYFDPDLGHAVDATVQALIEAGCRYGRTAIGGGTGIEPLLPGGREVGPADLKGLAVSYLGLQKFKGRKVAAFPPNGRIMFSFDFLFDEDTLEDMRQEEFETRAHADELGLTFTYEESSAAGERRVKACISFWEDYVLTLGSEETNQLNMQRALALSEAVYDRAKPYFGAMNAELHINAERSLRLLAEGKLPLGNEFALVGRRFVGALDVDALAASGYSWKVLSDGGALIQFARRWA